MLLEFFYYGKINTALGPWTVDIVELVNDPFSGDLK